ncbi:MAG: 6-phosphogluconolactonase [Chromatiales bacterium]|jgi:6-phosphogluconolactonase
MARRLIVEAGEFTQSAVTWIVEAVTEAVQQRGVCHLMLAGGGTPLPVYRTLARQDLPWDRLAVYFGDERCVPPDHPDSNYRAISEALFPAGVPEGLRLHRMRGEDDPAAAAAAYASLLPEQIDVLLLGTGEDGHTASLFPGSPALTESVLRVMPVIGSKPPPQRLTITPPVIQRAGRILVMVSGEGKAAAVRQAWEQGDLPVALARRGDWLLDRAAAALLQES